MGVVECVSEAIFDHGIDHNSVVHSMRISYVHAMRRLTHWLLSTTDNHLWFAEFNGLICQSDGLQSWAAQHVNSCGCDAIAATRIQGRLSGRVLTFNLNENFLNERKLLKTNGTLSSSESLSNYDIIWLSLCNVEYLLKNDFSELMRFKRR